MKMHLNAGVNVLAPHSSFSGSKSRSVAQLGASLSTFVCYREAKCSMKEGAKCLNVFESKGSCDSV